MTNFKTLSFLLFVLTGLFVMSCDDEEPAPEIRVGYSFSPNNPVAGEEVSFNNSSTGGTSFSWDFGDGGTSTEENPTYIFEAAGTYTVTLVVDENQENSFSEEIEVGQPSPQVSFTPDPIQQGIETTLSASVYNPTGATVTWNWQFPETGWTSADIDSTGAAGGESVMLTFTEPNPDFSITVTATIDGTDLTATSSVEVNAQLAKTLWISEKNGNLFSKKIFLEGEAQLEDSGIPSGARPLTLDFSDDRLYVFDAGSTIRFSADPEETPGQITSILYDGTDFKTHITFSDQAYDDAFFGSVDGEDLIFTDRRNDITLLPISTENAVWNPENGDANPIEFPALVSNNELGYYSAFANGNDSYNGPSYGFGAVNGTAIRRDGVYWWAKNSNHKGIYRFTADDIGVTDQIPEEGAILGDYEVRAFAIDEENAKIYFSSNKTNIGFYVADLDGSNVTLIDDAPVDGEGGANEYTYITDIVVDNESGYVYWAYRGPEDADLEANPTHESGIKQYKLDGTEEIEYFIQGFEAYGLAIDDTKR